jgi:hypothetical protein
MNVRKLNISLWTLTAVVAAGGIVVAGWAFVAPVEVAFDEPAPAHKWTPATSQASPDAQLSLESLTPIWNLTLRKSLTDSAGNTATNTQQENPATMLDGSGAPFVLVGTIGDSLAMVRTAAGTVEIKGIGEQANGAKILAIRPWQVDIELNGERKTVVKPREPGGG